MFRSICRLSHNLGEACPAIASAKAGSGLKVCLNTNNKPNYTAFFVNRALLSSAREAYLSFSAVALVIPGRMCLQLENNSH